MSKSVSMNPKQQNSLFGSSWTLAHPSAGAHTAWLLLYVIYCTLLQVYMCSTLVPKILNKCSTLYFSWQRGASTLLHNLWKTPWLLSELWNMITSYNVPTRQKSCFCNALERLRETWTQELRFFVLLQLNFWVSPTSVSNTVQAFHVPHDAARLKDSVDVCDFSQKSTACTPYWS